MKAVFLSYAFPPQNAPRAVQVARVAKFSSLPIRIVCAGRDDAGVDIRAGVDVVRFPDNSSRWWRLVKRFVYLPDSERTWADRVAKAVLRDKLVTGDDLLVTFGQPMSDHLAGLAIKRRLGVPWIAHFSDPWSDNPYLNGLTQRRLRKMEHAVISAADRVMFTSEETADLVMRKYPAEWRQKASVLPHAFDPLRTRPAATTRPADGPLVLRHIGNFYGPRNPLALVKALTFLHQTQPDLLENVRIELIGRWVGHESWSAAQTGLPDGLMGAPKSVDYEESLRLMGDADALLIVDAPFESNVFFPSKLVEYLWARRPILAVTPPGTTANIVAASGGVLASPESSETIAAGLAEMIERLRARTIGPPAEEVVMRYDATRVAAAFDQAALELLGRKQFSNSGARLAESV